MSFYGKYSEYKLLDADLLAWYLFNDSSDSGPNNNHLSFISGGSIFSSGRASFNSDFSEIVGVSPTTFTAFFDFEKFPHAAADLIVSNIDESSREGFSLGCSENGDYFLYITSPSGKYLRFFKSLKSTNRAIMVFSRSPNCFSLSIYDPISKQLKSESISVPIGYELTESNIKIGCNPSYSPPDFGGSIFYMYEFALISGGLPEFVVSSLCEEIFLSSNITEPFLQKFVSVSDKNFTFKLEQILFNTGSDTSLILPFSEASLGFSARGIETNGKNNRFYRQGVEELPSISGSLIIFSQQSPSDVVLLDNFSSGVSCGVNFSGFVSHASGMFPFEKPSLYSGSFRTNKNFVSLDTNSLCFNKYIVFEGNPNLFDL